MRNEKLDLLVTFDKNYIEPFKVMLGYAKYCISPFLWKAKTWKSKSQSFFGTIQTLYETCGRIIEM